MRRKKKVEKKEELTKDGMKIHRMTIGNRRFIYSMGSGYALTYKGDDDRNYAQILKNNKEKTPKSIKFTHSIFDYVQNKIKNEINNPTYEVGNFRVAVIDRICALTEEEANLIRLTHSLDS